jgi:HlyD family secretion protein
MMASLRRSRLVVFFAAAILVAALGVAFWTGWLWGGTPEPAPPEAVPLAPVKWLSSFEVECAEWTEVLGTTMPLPDRAARVTAPVEGRVISVLHGGQGIVMVEGQHVKKGDILVQLDASLLKANRDKIESGQEELKHLTRQAELAVKLAEIDVLRLAELNKNTVTDAKLPLVSRIEMEKAQVAYLDAESKQKAAASRETAARKELEALDRQLQLFTLTAPIDGRLGRMQVVLGQTLATGSLVADVIDIADKIDVLCFVPPQVAKRLKLGQEARAGGMEDKPEMPLNGKVEFIADQAEVDTGNFAVKIRFPNNDLGLRANTTLRVSVLTTPYKARVVINDSALFEDLDQPMVIVVENHKIEKVKEGDKEIDVETGKARKLRAKLGIRDRNRHVVEIVGLEDPEGKWTGTFNSETLFVTERGRGLRTGDDIKLQVED